jgi:hypothetical protein
MAVIGGLHSRRRIARGAYLALAPEVLREFKDAQMVIYGVTLVLFMQFLPGGLVSLAEMACAPCGGRPMTLLEIAGLSLSLFRPARLADVSFDVAEGAIVGLIGPNGAGKSTLLNCVSGSTGPNAVKSALPARTSSTAKFTRSPPWESAAPSRTWSCSGRRACGKT